MMFMFKICFYIAAIPFILMWWTLKAIFGLIAVLNPFAVASRRSSRKIARRNAARRSEEDLFRTTSQLMFWDYLNSH